MKVANVIKIPNQLIRNQWAQCNHKGPLMQKKETEEKEKEMAL